MRRKIPTRFRVTSQNIDAALRYRAVLANLADRWQPELRVLEVGSGSGGVAEWLEHEIVGVDTAFERTAERSRANLVEVIGSATSIPLEDGSFDVVLCVETLEHIAAEDRPRTLDELLRVLAPGGRLILTFPTGATAERLDRWLTTAYASRFGVQHPWAVEHLAQGVPDAHEIASQIRARGMSVRVDADAWAPAWQLLHGIYTVGRGLPFTWLLFRRPFVRVAYEIAARLDRRPAYRAILVVDRP